MYYDINSEEIKEKGPISIDYEQENKIYNIELENINASLVLSIKGKIEEHDLYQVKLNIRDFYDISRMMRFYITINDVIELIKKKIEAKKLEIIEEKEKLFFKFYLSNQFNEIKENELIKLELNKVKKNGEDITIFLKNSIEQLKNSVEQLKIEVEQLKNDLVLKDRENKIFENKLQKEDEKIKKLSIKNDEVIQKMKEKYEKSLKKISVQSEQRQKKIEEEYANELKKIFEQFIEILKKKVENEEKFQIFNKQIEEGYSYENKNNNYIDISKDYMRKDVFEDKDEDENENEDNELINGTSPQAFLFKNGPNYKVIKGLKVIKTSKGWWDATVLGNKYLEKNRKNIWKIKINKLKEADGIIIGIAQSDINQGNPCNCDTSKTFGLNSHNLEKYIKGTCSEYGNGKLSQGDIVEVGVDLKIKTLEFSINGKNLGVAYDKLSEDINYLPYIELCNKGSEIELIQSNIYQ